MLLRATLKYLPAQVLAPLAQLASMVAWTHWLSPLEMGTYTLVVSTQELAYLIILSWFSLHALRSLPGAEQDPTARQRFLVTENAVLAATCGAMVLAALLQAVALPQALTAQGVLAIAAFFITRALNTHYAERARGQSSYVAYALLQSAGPIGGLMLGVLALQAMPPSATVLFLGYAVANLLGTVAALPLLGTTRRIGLPDRALLTAAWGYGGPMLGLMALGWIAENHLRYLVQWQAGAVALGLMSVGWGLGRRCASVASMLVTTAGFPIASRLLNEGRREEAVSQLAVNAALLLAVTLPISAGFFFIGPALVALTVAPEYRDVTAQVLGLSVLSGTVRYLHVHIADQWHVLERRFALAARIDVVEIACCLTASAIGLTYWGVPGAVWGQLVGEVLTMGYSQWHASVRHDFRWPWRDTIKVLSATGLMSLALATLGTAPSPLGIGFSLAVGALTYALAMAALYAGPLKAQAERMKARASRARSA